jgi:hypothetical protein
VEEWFLQPKKTFLLASYVDMILVIDKKKIKKKVVLFNNDPFSNRGEELRI